jgi:ABC-type polysaccharide/polyol phosphate transport system ATPase subunit
LAGVSVRYRLPTARIDTLKEHVLRRLRGHHLGYREFWALRDLDLSIRSGETLGLIGRNGAGKSTLLKVIARVLRPTGGRVWVRGQVAPLIELGTGFHPELTGRENIYLTGSMVGFSRRQMRQKFESIVEFAELAPFIDAPLRTYSSGMVMRLGFAIATDVEPDILIIDEILAVGDEAFQQKCLVRMNRFREQGTTILFVSHKLDDIQSICERVVWIDHGRVCAEGAVDQVIEAYRAAS